MRNSNTAYKYDYYPTRSTAAPQRKPQQRAEIKNLPVKQYNTSLSNHIFIRFIAAACAVFMISFIIYTRIEISDTKAKIVELDSQISVLDSEETRIMMEIENKISYANIEEAAAALGMQKKSASQVYYIDKSEAARTEIIPSGK